MKMRKMNSVFGKVLVSVMLVLGLTAVSCNQRSDVKVREDREDARIRERQDSIDLRRDQSVEPTDEVRDNTGVDPERDRDMGRDTTIRP